MIQYKVIVLLLLVKTQQSDCGAPVMDKCKSHFEVAVEMSFWV